MPTHAAGPPAFDKFLLRAAMIASAGAAAIHLGAAHSHLLEYTPAGAFMFLSGFVQFAWVIWMIRPSRAVFVAGAAGNLGIVALWIASRTVGLPVGAEPWMREDIHSTDALATALEIVVVLACLALLRPTLRRATHRLAALAATGMLLSVLATAHEPARERAVAVATLLLVAATGGLTAVISRLPAASTSGREHVEASHDHSRHGVFDSGAWPTVGARGI